MQQPPEVKIDRFVEHCVDPIDVRDAAYSIRKFLRALVSELDNDQAVYFPDDDRIFRGDELRSTCSEILKIPEGKNGLTRGAAIATVLEVAKAFSRKSDGSAKTFDSVKDTGAAAEALEAVCTAIREATHDICVMDVGGRVREVLRHLRDNPSLCLFLPGLGTRCWAELGATIQSHESGPTNVVELIHSAAGWLLTAEDREGNKFFETGIADDAGSVQACEKVVGACGSLSLSKAGLASQHVRLLMEQLFVTGSSHVKFPSGARVVSVVDLSSKLAVFDSRDTEPAPHEEACLVYKFRFDHEKPRVQLQYTVNGGGGHELYISAACVQRQGLQDIQLPDVDEEVGSDAWVNWGPPLDVSVVSAESGGVSILVLAGAGDMDGRYVETGTLSQGREGWRKDGLLFTEHNCPQIWYAQSKWRIGTANNQYFTNDNNPPPKGLWSGWRKAGGGRHHATGLKVTKVIEGEFTLLATWRDQGWGEQKGKIRACTVGSSDPLPLVPLHTLYVSNPLALIRTVAAMVMTDEQRESNEFVAKGSIGRDDKSSVEEASQIVIEACKGAKAASGEPAPSRGSSESIGEVLELSADAPEILDLASAPASVVPSNDESSLPESTGPPKDTDDVQLNPESTADAITAKASDDLPRPHSQPASADRKDLPSGVPDGQAIGAADDGGSESSPRNEPVAATLNEDPLDKHKTGYFSISHDDDEEVLATVPLLDAENLATLRTDEGIIRSSDNYLLRKQEERMKLLTLDASPGCITLAQVAALQECARHTDGNPRRIKRVINVLQLISEYAARLHLDEAKFDTKLMVSKDPRWPLFSLKLIKWVLLCEVYPMRMSFLVLRILDMIQKEEVNDIELKHDERFKVNYHPLADASGTEQLKEELDRSMLISTAFFQYSEAYYVAHKHYERHLQQDGDIEGFALLLSMPLPKAAVALLPRDAVGTDGQTPIDEKNSYDITVHDIVGADFTLRSGDEPSKENKGKDKDFFSLLQYSFNLTPALREEISKDLSAMLTEREPHLKDQEQCPRPSLRPSSIERKASFVLKQEAILKAALAARPHHEA